VKEGTSNSVPPALEYRLARESDMPEPERFEITAGEQLLMPCGSYAAARAALEAAAPKPYPEPRNRREKRKAAAEARRRR
jgi:hypothetical protein